jgi:uncharacterized protein (UPF0212 family)
MFEGYIASKFANKYFEKDVFKTIRLHALFGALIMMIPDFGFGTLFFIGVLWHMYSSICKKVGISFSDNFWALVGVGVVVNIIVAFAIDLVFSVLFFLVGFISYFQFYFSGKLFVESLKQLNFDGQNNSSSSKSFSETNRQIKNVAPKEIPQIKEKAPSPLPDNSESLSAIPISKPMISCPICGEKVEKGIKICPYCNESIEQEDKLVESLHNPENIELQENEMMRCPICGELIPVGSQVCPKCDEKSGASFVIDKKEERGYYKYDIDVSNLHTNERVQKYGYADAKVETIITNKDMDKNLVNPSHSSVTLSGMYRSAPNAEYIDIEVKVLGNSEVPQYIGSYLFNDIELKRINNTTLFLYENMPYQFIEAKMFSCPICGEKIPEGCTICPECKEPLI